MLNEERVVMMTKMAAYEQGEGKKNIEVGNYFRSDYISIQIMKTIVSTTVAFAIMLALFIFYDFENFMMDIYKMDLLTFAKSVLIYYAVLVVGYGIVAYAVYSYRYTKAKKSLRGYYQSLKKLNAMYKEQ